MILESLSFAQGFVLGVVSVLSILVCYRFGSRKYKDMIAGYEIYLTLLFIVTIFVVINWNDCILMQFFSEFNGYNIIFLCWIFLLALSIFEIDFNGIRSFKTTTKPRLEKLGKEIEAFKNIIPDEDASSAKEGSSDESHCQ